MPIHSTRRRKLAQPSVCIAPEKLETRQLLSATGGHHEHAAVMALVPDNAVTHTAIADGDWSDAAIWANGEVPAEDANVAIPANTVVTIGGDLSSTPLSTIRVDGTLRFDVTTDSHLVVETIVVRQQGLFEVGSNAEPVPADTSIRITFRDTGELDSTVDPRRLGRGLLSMGRVRIVGSQIQSHVKITYPIEAGDSQLQVATTNHNWQVGDQLVVPGVNQFENQDEERVITAIDGNTITLDRALDFDHLTPLKKLRINVANLSRNVVFESQNASDTGRRGHTMFMDPSRTQIQHAAFNGLGRTDKRTPIEDARFREDGSWIEGTGANVRGRYSVHFHQGGTEGNAALFQGNSVVDSPGWGVVNHSSNVKMLNNVVYHVVGAAFVTEAGDEIGAVRNNIAIRSTGSGDALLKRTEQQDFGHGGNGFWFEGAGVKVSGNIASGHANIGFMYFVRAMRFDDGSRVRFDSQNLQDDTIAKGKDSVDIRHVPLFEFRRNTAFAVGQGLQTWFHLPRSVDGELYPSVVDRLTVWHASSRGVQVTYSSGLTFRNSIIIGDLQEPAGYGFNHHPVTDTIRYENTQIEGFEIGIDAPVRGHNQIVGGKYRNVTNIRVNMSQDPQEYSLDIEDGTDGRPLRFAELRKSQLGGQTQSNLEFDYIPHLKHHQNPNALFIPITMRINAGGFDNKQIFFEQQGANYVPFPEAQENVPNAFVGMTNTELNEQYGLAVAGYVAPENASFNADQGVYFGEPQDQLVALRLRSGLHTNDEYKLKYSAGDETFTETEASEIAEGWNPLTRIIDGQKRTLLVYGDTVAPTFELQPKTPTVLNHVDRDATIFIYGRVIDDSPSQGRYKKSWSLSEFDVETDEEGREYLDINLEIKDAADNRSMVAFPIYLDTDAATLAEIYRNDLDDRSIPDILLED